MKYKTGKLKSLNYNNFNKNMYHTDPLEKLKILLNRDYTNEATRDLAVKFAGKAVDESMNEYIGLNTQGDALPKQ